MNVLSLFDGMSCGHIALERAGGKVDNYFASEVDKYAIQVTMANYPNTIQLGDVCRVEAKDLPRIDLLIGGSPCQGFSIAGKGLHFEDFRSKLFFEFVRILDEIKKSNPDVKFLLENVKMKKEYAAKINELLGVQYVEINSALFSAQNRVRYYWTNIPIGELPKDKGLTIEDILVDDVPEKYFLSEKMIKGFEKESSFSGKFTPLNSFEKKASCITTKEGSRRVSNFICHNLQPRNGKGRGGKGHLAKNDGKTYCLDTRNNMAIQKISNRVYGAEGKSCCLAGEAGGSGTKTGLYYANSRIRRLTPTECERLQTVPDGYTDHVSDTQRYRMLGNGWTVDVVAWIFKHLDREYADENKKQQTTIFEALKLN